MNEPPSHRIPSHDLPTIGVRCIGLAVGIAFIMGSVGFWLYERDNGIHHASPFSPCYHAVQLFILHTPYLDGKMNWVLEVARWLAPVALGWFAVTGVLALFEKDIRLFLFPRRSGHTVICGLGQRGLQLVECYGCRAHDQLGQYSCRRIGRALLRFLTRHSFSDVVAIEHESQSAAIGEAEEQGAIVVIGNVTHPTTLARARAAHAAKVVAICGEDGTNIEIAVRLIELVEQQNPQRKPPLQCHVQLTDVALRNSFERTGLSRQKGGRVRVHFFDVYESHVRTLLAELPLDCGGLGESDPRRVHLFVLGLGRLAEALILKTAQLGHFANRKPPLISVIDRTADVKQGRLLFRYPALADCCELDFHQHEVESPAARELLRQAAADPHSITTIAVCFDDDCRCLDIALRLHSALRGTGIRIAVRLSSPNGLARLLDKAESTPGVKEQLQVFGMVKDGCCERIFADENQDRLAEAIHADFVKKRTSPTRTPDSDSALKPWEDLEDHLYKDSNRQQADHLPIKLRTVGRKRVPLGDPRPEATLTETEVELLAEMEHARWVAERMLAGWVFAPPPKNEVERTSPHLVPWARLDEVRAQYGIKDDVKQYDRDAVLNIPNILRGVGEKLVRENQSPEIPTPEQP